MASAAIRETGTPETGAEMVRRLLAHSSRVRAQAGSARIARPLGRLTEEGPTADEEIARLESEIAVLRAALKAEQDEVAALRAEIEEIGAYSAPVGDIRNDRDRWATLVERLLFTER